MTAPKYEVCERIEAVIVGGINGRRRRHKPVAWVVQPRDGRGPRLIAGPFRGEDRMKNAQVRCDYLNHHNL